MATLRALQAQTSEFVALSWDRMTVCKLVKQGMVYSREP